MPCLPEERGMQALFGYEDQTAPSAGSERSKKCAVGPETETGTASEGKEGVDCAVVIFFRHILRIRTFFYPLIIFVA